MHPWLCALLLTIGLDDQHLALRPEVGLDPAQRIRIESIYRSNDEKLAQIGFKEGALKESAKSDQKVRATLDQQLGVLEKQREKLLRTQWDEINKLLSESQRGRLAKLEKLNEEGVPIGGDLFRSFKTSDYYAPQSAGRRVFSQERDRPDRTTPIERQATAMQSAASRPRDGIKFDVTNRSDTDYPKADLQVSFLLNGKRVNLTTVKVKELRKKQTIEVAVPYTGEFDDIEVKFDPP